VEPFRQGSAALGHRCCLGELADLVVGVVRGVTGDNPDLIDRQQSLLEHGERLREIINPASDVDDLTGMRW